MIKLVAGNTGAGKTKSLIDMANDSVKMSNGHIVYLDGDSSHMYDLSHEIRYTNISNYPINNYGEFFGFMCGILSEDNDIDEIYADGLLKLAHVHEVVNSDELIEKLKKLSNQFKVKFIMSINCDTSLLPNFIQDHVVA
jgi:hypothetical protein